MKIQKPLSNINNTGHHLELAKATAKEFSKMVLHDPETADAELLPTDPSPRKVILPVSHPEWSEFAY
jgi:hypothetical protein